MKFEVQGLCKSFGDNRVLQGIDFATESGKAFGLLGRNGAGKTTTIRIVMGVFPADDGRVLVDGSPIDHGSLRAGYLPEEHGLYPKVVITEQLVYLARLRGMTARDAKKSIKYWLERLEMERYAGKKLDTLSKGNQQKIQLVAALVTDPEILILDEPFSGLDPVNAALLKDVVKETIKKGKIVLFSSHQMSYVEEFCDDIAILHKGEIALSGAISDIKRSYDRSVLVVRSPQWDQVERYCAGQLADIVKETRMKKDALLVTLADAGDKPLLMQRLGASGLDVDSVGVFEPSLNDIFVQYAGGDEDKEGQAQ